MEQSGSVLADEAISVSEPDRARIVPRMGLLSCFIDVSSSIRTRVAAFGLGVVLFSHQCLLM